MDNEVENLRKKITELESKIAELERRALTLEAELESKNIVIDALVNQVKLTKGQHVLIEDKTVKRIKYNDDAQLENEEDKVKCNKIKKTQTQMKYDTTSDTLREYSCEGKDNLAANNMEIISQIKGIFVLKSKNVEFKQNFTFKKFVEYAETSYEFSLSNKKVSRTKNPLRLYIEGNIDRIIKYIIENINILNLNQICSALFLINSEIEYTHKLVIAHDVILHLDDFTGLLFINAALFNNLELRDDQFSGALSKVLYKQYTVDSNIIKDHEVLEYINTIKRNMKLEAGDQSLWSLLGTFSKNAPVFDPKKNKIISEAVENGFIVRMLSHYLDWDYTYNTLILTSIHPMITSHHSPICTYFLGILAVNAIRIFNSDESIELIFQELKEILTWMDDSSVIAYLILKQFYEIECEAWIVKNRPMIEKLGYEIPFLRNFLLV